MLNFDFFMLKSSLSSKYFNCMTENPLPYAVPVELFNFWSVFNFSK